MKAYKNTCAVWGYTQAQEMFARSFDTIREALFWLPIKVKGYNSRLLNIKHADNIDLCMQ